MSTTPPAHESLEHNFCDNLTPIYSPNIKAVVLITKKTRMNDSKYKAELSIATLNPAATESKDKANAIEKASFSDITLDLSISEHSGFLYNFKIKLRLKTENSTMLSSYFFTSKFAKLSNNLIAPKKNKIIKEALFINHIDNIGFIMEPNTVDTAKINGHTKIIILVELNGTFILLLP
jgi:hypothetical protein